MVKHVPYVVQSFHNVQDAQLMVQFVMLVVKVFIRMLLVIFVNLAEMLDLDVLTVLMLQLAQDATQQPILLLLLFKEDVSVLVLFI
jgi:hypothetical protein